MQADARHQQGDTNTSPGASSSLGHLKTIHGPPPRLKTLRITRLPEDSRNFSRCLHFPRATLEPVLDLADAAYPFERNATAHHRASRTRLGRVPAIRHTCPLTVPRSWVWKRQSWSWRHIHERGSLLRKADIRPCSTDSSGDQIFRLSPSATISQRCEGDRRARNPCRD